MIGLKNSRFDDIVKENPEMDAPYWLGQWAVKGENTAMYFFGKELLAGKSTKIEWHKPVYAEDVLHGKAVITNLTRRNAKNGLVEITIKAYNQHGVHVLSDVTEAIVMCREEE